MLLRARALLLPALLLAAGAAGAQPLDTFVRFSHASFGSGQSHLRWVEVGSSFRADATAALRSALGDAAEGSDAALLVEVLADEAIRRHLLRAPPFEHQEGPGVLHFLITVVLDGTGRDAAPRMAQGMTGAGETVWLSMGERGLTRAVDRYVRRTGKAPRKLAVGDVLLLELGATRLLPGGVRAGSGEPCVSVLGLGVDECAPIITELR